MPSRCSFCGRPSVGPTCSRACAAALPKREPWPLPGPRAVIRKTEPEPRRFRWQEVE